MNHKEYIEQLLASGNIGEAIHQFMLGTKQNGQQNIYGNLILLSARFHSNENDKFANVITEESYKIEKAKTLKLIEKSLKEYQPLPSFNENTTITMSDSQQIDAEVNRPEFFISEMKRQFEDEYKKIQRYEKLLSDMRDKTLRTEYEEEIELCEDNISRIEKKYFKKIRDYKPQISEKDIEQMIMELKNSIHGRFDDVDEKLKQIQFTVQTVINSINEQEIENNNEDKLKAEQLLQEILLRIDKLEPAKKREIGSDLNAETTTSAKLKLVIPLIPTILSYETEFILAAKEPIKTWKDVWKVFFKSKS